MARFGSIPARVWVDAGVVEIDLVILQHFQRKPVVTLEDLVSARVALTCKVNMSRDQLPIGIFNRDVLVVDQLANAIGAIFLGCACLASFIVATCRIKLVHWLAVMHGRKWSVGVRVETVAAIGPELTPESLKRR